MATRSVPMLTAVLFALAITTTAVADDTVTRRLSLVLPNSLAGWLHGDAAPSGWTADGQRLRGCAAGSPLVAGWSFGDFTLEFVWSAVGEGALEVLLPTSPDGDLLTIGFDPAHAGRIIDGDKELAAGRKLATDMASHRCQIIRSGENLSVTIDGERASEITIAGERRLGLSLHVTHGVVAIDELTLSEPHGQAIFNGVDLTGWNTKEKADIWTVENGEFVTMKKGGEYLRSDEEYENFTLTFDYLTHRGGNSGLGIRTPIGKWPSGEGMELQIYDRPGLDNSSQMSIYRHVPPLARPDVSEVWNHVVVKCDGPIITAWVNGQLAQHVDLDQHPRLAKKPRRGWLGFQHHGSQTRIKSVHLLAAPASAEAEERVIAP